MNTTPTMNLPSKDVPDELFKDEWDQNLASSTNLYADIVFDRPLDHAYTYEIPESLRDAIAVGKRVEAPFGRGDRSTVGYCVGLSADKPHREVKELRKVIDEDILLTDQLLRLTRWMADYYLCGWGQVLQAVLPAGVRDRAGTRETVLIEAVSGGPIPDPSSILPAKQRAVWKQLRRAGKPLELRQLLQLAKCGAGPVSSLVEKGFAKRTVLRTENLEIEIQESTSEPPAPIHLNEDQQQVWQTIREALEVGDYQTFLLHGVTGSGKTEIYLRAIEEVIRRGREVIVLVPEISLTPQTIERFRGRCDSVAVMHSNLTDAERGAHWRRIAAGHVQVVVGARSAIFAPTRKLGLIIIDEEHESSFKQEATPRYHARDVAVMRARLENVPMVMGSATPALESWHNVQRGHYTLLSLPQRVESRPLPEVQLIDMRHEPKPSGPPGSAISPSLESAMNDALKAGGQVMLLLNRRGYSTHVHCPTCGAVVSCAHCDLALTFHRHRNSLVCHHCGYEQDPVSSCPACGKKTVRYQGFGTEKLQSEVEAKFPDKVIQRMDSDTMSKPGSHARVLDAFRNGLINILVGTQMIAKGLDFPNVTLVGVINADVGLHLPDFRSAERTFQLLAQVAGRTGRGPKGGRVYVQTFTPEHPSIGLAAKHDFRRFAEMELAHRAEFRYPPFERLARLIIRSEKQEAAQQFADHLAGAFREALAVMQRRDPHRGEVRLLGPAEAPVFRLNNFFRYHFQLQSESPGALHQVLRDVLHSSRPPANVEYQLDVDPYQML